MKKRTFWERHPSNVFMQANFKNECEVKDCLCHSLLKKKLETGISDLEKMEEVKKILKDNQFVLMFLPEKTTKQKMKTPEKTIYAIICENKDTANFLNTSIGEIINSLKDNIWKALKKEIKNNFSKSLIK